MSSTFASPQAWTTEDVKNFLARPFPPTRTSPLYLAALVVVAVVLVALQAIYALVVVLAAWGTVYYTLLIPDILRTIGFNYVSVLLSAIPVAAGLTVTFFLLKPLLARPARPPELYRLSRAEQPVFFSFVDLLSERLGAPRPSSIEMDVDVFAFAALESWRDIFRGRLKLGFGLPLAAELTLPQFTAVLAHELAHFSQRGGQRVYYLIERIRRWFRRVVYERDAWDERLDHAWEKGGVRNKAFVGVAIVGVFLSRSILKGLLFCATLVSAWLSRQMEVNADRRCAQLVGGQTTVEMLKKLTILSAVTSRMRETVQGTLGPARRLCDDLAPLLRATEESLPEDVRDSLIAAELSETTGILADHPALRDRISHVSGIPGVIQNAQDVSATAVFTDFEQLSRGITLRAYRLMLEDKLENVTLENAADYISRLRNAVRREKALELVFGAFSEPARYFRLSDGAPEPFGDAPATDAIAGSSEFSRLLEESISRNTALEFVRGGGQVAAPEFHLSGTDLPTVEREAAESRACLAAELERLRALCRRLVHSLHGAGEPFEDAYRALSAEQEALLDLVHDATAMTVVDENANLLSASEAATVLENGTRRLREKSLPILARLAGCPSPLTRGRTLATEMTLNDPPESIDPIMLASRLVSRAEAVGAEILGELCLRTIGRPANAIQIKVLSGGSVLLNDNPSTVEEVAAYLRERKNAPGTVVQYYREEAPGERLEEIARTIMDAVAEAELPVRLAVNPDFSDWIEPQEPTAGTLRSAATA